MNMNDKEKEFILILTGWEKVRSPSRLLWVQPMSGKVFTFENAWLNQVETGCKYDG